MSLDDVAKVTKIQPRILERLEAGKLEGLPAEVFVRGFVRSFARCVGLDEREALRRHAACSGISAVGTGDLTPAARALVEAMAELAPGSATAARATPRKMLAVEVDDRSEPDRVDLHERPPERSPERSDPAIAVPAAAGDQGGEDPGESPGSSGSPSEDGNRAMSTAPAIAVQTASDDAWRDAELPLAPPAPPPPPELSAAMAAMAPMSPMTGHAIVAGGPAAATQADRLDRERSRKKKRRAKRSKRGSGDPDRLSRDRIASGTPANASPVVTGGVAASAVAPATWAPGMRIAAASAPWRRPVLATASSPAIVPSLVIDDADPESAERVLEERAGNAPRRSFLPPILLDREDRWARQGALTLAVILLLIAATLTLSYLMRRPSTSGDGMTRSGIVLDAARG